MNVSTKIIQWFYLHGRKNLPWQKKKTLYRVWISEIMLQQTQVQTVIPYFERFMIRFPNLEALAKAPEDEVLKLWAGLGYYARARNLHKTSVLIQSKHAGVFPEDFSTLLTLPGIGPSTAGAILSLTLKHPYPILDGNVKRILCRYYAIEGAPTLPKVEKKLWQLSTHLTPKKNVDIYNQAMMDLGATICTRRNPKCDLCPLQTQCAAKKMQRVENFPNPKPKVLKPKKSAQFLIICHQNKILLKQQPNTGIWGGLWTLPELSTKENVQQFLKEKELKCETPKRLAPIKHSFTHFHLQIIPILCKVKKRNELLKVSDYRWHNLKGLTTALPAPIKKLVKNLCEKSTVLN